MQKFDKCLNFGGTYYWQENIASTYIGDIPMQCHNQNEFRARGAESSV